jgi:ElaA protein
MPLAYARLLDPGVKYAEPSMGRVITTAAARGTGLGRQLVRRAIELSARVHPGLGMRISAQSRLERFYEEAGFAVVGERYLEDGIPHTEMVLSDSIERGRR